jgi:hypothetical protein
MGKLFAIVGSILIIVGMLFPIEQNLWATQAPWLLWSLAAAVIIITCVCMVHKMRFFYFAPAIVFTAEIMYRVVESFLFRRNFELKGYIQGHIDSGGPPFVFILAGIALCTAGAVIALGASNPIPQNGEITRRRFFSSIFALVGSVVIIIGFLPDGREVSLWTLLQPPLFKYLLVTAILVILGMVRMSATHEMRILCFIPAIIFCWHIALLAVKQPNLNVNDYIRWHIDLGGAPFIMLLTGIVFCTLGAVCYCLARSKVVAV